MSEISALHMSGMQKKEKKDAYIKDVRQVRRELIEQIRKPGSYCQDYETFKGIYRFLEWGASGADKRHV